jgi:hypothetical protein
MAKLVPPDAADEPDHLGNAKGWLDDDDPSFAAVHEVVGDRPRHVPRVFAESPAQPRTRSE